MSRPVGGNLGPDIELRWQPDGPLDAHGLAPAGIATDQADSAPGNAEGICQELDQPGIGLALHRRRCDAQLEPAVVQTGEAVTTGARLQMAEQQQVGALPAVRVQMPTTSSGGSPTLAAMWRSTILITLITRNTRIGDRSRPPIGGNSLRKGASTGSVSWWISSTIGL